MPVQLHYSVSCAQQLNFGRLYTESMLSQDACSILLSHAMIEIDTMLTCIVSMAAL